MSIQSVLVVPFPAQGHVNPMMSFSKKLVENGVKVIFLNTEYNHKRVVSSMQGEEQDHQQGEGGEFIKLVSIPDGLGPEDDRTDFEKLCPAILSTMPFMVEKLIEDIHLNGEYGITCIVADVPMAWVLDVGRKLGINNGALFWGVSAAMCALLCNIPKLINDGIIDSDGLPTNEETFQISPRMPVMDRGALFWLMMPGSTSFAKALFNYTNHCTKSLDQTEWWLCNTSNELEPGALSFVPKLQPIGPLLSTTHENKIVTTTLRSMGQFWEEDLSCMSWLDQQPHQSVVYVAFGSLTLFDQNQFKEIALGIELTNRPFLWAVRPDSNMAYPSEFLGSKGKIVTWAPQQKVLSHPAIACFVSHCGWNSTIEGLSNGVPFLCWPYLADHFYNKTYVCDELKVGMGFDPDENGLVSRWEITKKVDQLLSDEKLRSRSLELKKKVMKDIAEGGGSSENLKRFVKWLNQKE